MSVLITWATTSAGASEEELDAGDVSNGANTAATTIYLSHDHSGDIVSARLFVIQKLSTYDGAATAADDLSEVIGWGDESTANGFGGLQINSNTAGGFDGGSTWGMSESQKTSVDGLKFTARTGVGNTAPLGVLVPVEAHNSGPAMVTPGSIPATTEVAFQIRIKVPTDEGTLGAREVSLALSYTYTP